MNWPRPARPRAPIAVAVLVLFVWWVVAHNSGSGWVQALGDAVFGMLAIGIFAPAVATGRVRVEISSSPTDATTGAETAIQLRASSRARIRPLEPSGREVMVGPGEGRATLIPARRGVHERVVLDVATAAPFGLQWWSRLVTVALPVTLHVAPRAGRPDPISNDHDDLRGELNGSTGRNGPAGVDPHSVRDYAAGDRRQRVHWPASAHSGRLMVREVEEPPTGTLRIRVSLPQGPEAAEREAGDAYATAIAALDRGMAVEMQTDETDGPVIGIVTDRRTAGRRLARAVPARDGMKEEKDGNRKEAGSLSPKGAARTPSGPGSSPTGILEKIKKANQPGEPENSIRLRVAATAVVLVGVAACAAEYELARSTALLAAVLIVAGMVFSYATRVRPPGYIKILAALGAVSLLVWFVHALSGGQITDITAVESPLTVLFVGIQVVHSFHVPTRRDLMFTIAGGAGLMALAAAQSIDMTFAFYALPWFVLTLWALVESWRSASGGAKVSTRATAGSVVAVCAASLVVFFLLPAPTVAVRIGFVSAAGSGGPVPVPGALAGDGGGATQLARAGTAAGRSRVGGYLGFSNSLNTALRGNLGKTLIMRVRAQRPSYWIGETFDRWDGQNWISTAPADQALRGGSPFFVPLPVGDIAGGEPDLQTFYVANTSPDLVFHAERAQEVWFPTRSLFTGTDGTIVSPIGLGKGAIYTVQSYTDEPTAAELRAAGAVASDPVRGHGNYTSLPRPYTRAAALAQEVTAGETNTYDKVEALIGWIGSHTRYSTDIPPLARGADTVNEFLFGSRVGFCEQISTSLAVMLRTLGIPAREAVGYVPGGYNPVTDLYDVRAEDAHSWVQVWFPGYGWQSFDPTVVVPTANPSPGATALHDVGGVPAVPAGAGVGGIGAAVVGLRWRRRRPRTWDERVVAEMQRVGRRHGRARRGPETLLEYGAALDAASSDGLPDAGWASLASRVSAVAYGGRELPVSEQRLLVGEARRLRAASPRAPFARSTWRDGHRPNVG